MAAGNPCPKCKRHAMPRDGAVVLHEGVAWHGDCWEEFTGIKK